MVCENGTMIFSPGLFTGELIVMVEASHRSILMVMNTSDPDVTYMISVFTELVQKSFPQYIFNQNVIK